MVSDVFSTRSVPVHSRVLGLERLIVEVEIVVNTVKEGTRSAIELSIVEFPIEVLILGELFSDASQDAFLGNKSLLFCLGGGLKRVIVVAIAVNVWIDETLL